MKNKKTIIKFGIGIFFLIALVVGATYAYFQLNVSNSYNTTRVTGNVEDVGSVALKLENNIYMDLKAYDMQKWENDVTYYASANGVTTEETEEVIAYTQATGNHTYTCTYTLEVTDVSTNSTYNAFQNMSTKSDGQIVLTVDGKDYDFNTNSLFPLTIDGVIDNVSSTSVGEIKAKYKMVNSSAIDQSALAGTDMKLEFKATNFECDTTRLLSAIVRKETKEIFAIEPKNETTLSQSDYLNVNTTATFNNYSKWQMEISKGQNSVIFNAPETAIYQICWNIWPKGSNIDFNVLVDDNKVMSKNFYHEEMNVSYEDCRYIGYIELNDKIEINYDLLNSTNTGNIYFYIQKTTETIGDSAGYRYTGKNPNNYVEFNDELWRIIGNVPTFINDNGKNASVTLVKLIKENSIGMLVLDSETRSYGSYGGFVSGTLRPLLNNYYYGALDGTGTEGCYSTSNTTATTCNYETNGIIIDSLYGKMIKNVYMTDVHAGSDWIPAAIYNREISNLSQETNSGYIGIMSLSDYGYAAEDKDYFASLKDYSTKVNDNWLYSGKDEWTTFSAGGYSKTRYYIDDTGNTLWADNNTGKEVRPVVYLDKMVYVTDGDGTRENPYQIGLD